ncbi:MAG: GTP-binding protein [Pollutimonas bauzanensis]
MASDAAVRRPAFIKAISALLADSGVELLRVKGMLWFEGDSHASAVHAVHRQLYPMEPMETHARAAQSPGASVLVLIFRAAAGSLMPDKVAQLLPGAQLSLSSGRNFAQ